MSRRLPFYSSSALLYLALAQSLVLGDPTEYTLVANVLGILPPLLLHHPAGQAVSRPWYPLATFPGGCTCWRQPIATAAALAVYDVVRQVARRAAAGRRARAVGAGGAALRRRASPVATATSFWQHAIPPNPHIITPPSWR